MRGYKEQFEPEVASKIEKLVLKIEQLRYPTGPARYYGLDLSMCLKSGALAGSMIIASALLEIFVRGLVVKYAENAQQGWSRQVEAEKELEEMRRLGFGKLLDHLVSVGLFYENDSERAKKIYNQVRIPAHHGLSSRLLGRDKDNPSSSIMALLGRTGTVSQSEFESFVETEALPVVEEIASILERNQVGAFSNT